MQMEVTGGGGGGGLILIRAQCPQNCKRPYVQTHTMQAFTIPAYGVDNIVYVLYYPSDKYIYTTVKAMAYQDNKFADLFLSRYSRS